MMAKRDKLREINIELMGGIKQYIARIKLPGFNAKKEAEKFEKKMMEKLKKKP